MAQPGKILLIYTGGTIGMAPRDPNNQGAPLVPKDWDYLQQFLPSLDQLPTDIVPHEMVPIDSSDMDPKYWVTLAKLIAGQYADYDGFVVLHGTDTMAYTASALSFLLGDLGKPVVLTGSQAPISHPATDATQNLISSIRLAAPRAFDIPTIPEVCICFGGRVLRGNRARKVNSGSIAAFDSPNYPLLGEAGESIRVNLAQFRKSSSSSLAVESTMETQVLVLEIFPGIRTDVLTTVLGMGTLKGVILKTFGAGNAPTSEGFLAPVRRAITANDVVVVNITQCVSGSVKMGKYGTSTGLVDAGVVSGGDMTPEAALTKLQFLLGKYRDTNEVKRLLQEDLRGELTVSGGTIEAIS